MKRLLPVLLIVPLALACNRKAAPAAAGTGTTTAPAQAAQPPAPGAADATNPHGPAAKLPEAKPLPAQIPDVVARVNGEAIKRDELQAAVSSVEARAGHAIPDDQKAAFTRQILDQLVEFHVLALEAKTRKVEVADAEVKARLDQMKQGFPNEQAFQQALTQQRITMQQLQDQARMGMQIDKLVDTEITSKIAVQDSDVTAFYQQNVGRFKQDESVHASHILIAVPQSADAKQKADAKAKAEQVLKLVKGGGDFAAIAKAQSQDPGSAPNGGDLGFFPKGQMEPRFEEIAFGLKPGAVSGVVETPFGFHIIKVSERRAPRTAPLQEVSAEIKQFLTEQQRETRLQQFVDQAKAKVKVEILI